MLIVTSQQRIDESSDKSRQRAGMKVLRCRKALTTSQLGAELAHLLRRPMSSRTQYLDAGTMCRESALLVASIAVRLGLTAEICDGRMELIGPTLSGLKGIMEFETHCWVDIEGIGICDFSPDLTEGAGLGWKRWPVRYLIGTRYFPRVKDRIGEYFTNEAQFQARSAEIKQQIPRFATLYLENARRKFDAALFHVAVEFARSYLVEDLMKQPFFSPNIFSKAAVHLWTLTQKGTRSLADRSQLDAWRTISSIPDAAVERFWQRLIF